MRYYEKKRSARSANRNGQALVEFSLTLMLALTVLFGIVEVSMLLMTYNTLAESARAGARYAMVHGFDRSGSGVDGPSGPGCDANPPSGASVAPNVVSAVTTLANAAGLSSSRLAVSVCYPGTNKTGQRVTVIASYAYRPMYAFLRFASPINMSSTTQGTICY